MSEKRHPVRKGLFLFIGLWMGCAIPVFGQLIRGTISGKVTDRTGAVIQKARVIIQDVATHKSRTSETNDRGYYRFAALDAGVYSIEWVAPGFERLRLEEVRVGPAEEVVLNETLEVAGAPISIDVRDTVPVSGLAKAGSTLQRSISPTVIQKLPLSADTRDVTAMARSLQVFREVQRSQEFLQTASELGRITISSTGLTTMIYWVQYRVCC
jgi:hypothetical protein